MKIKTKRKREALCREFICEHTIEHIIVIYMQHIHIYNIYTYNNAADVAQICASAGSTARGGHAAATSINNEACERASLLNRMRGQLVGWENDQEWGCTGG